MRVVGGAGKGTRWFRINFRSEACLGAIRTVRTNRVRCCTSTLVLRFMPFLVLTMLEWPYRCVDSRKTVTLGLLPR